MQIDPAQLIEIVFGAMATAIALLGAAIVKAHFGRDGRGDGLALFLLLSGIDSVDSLLQASDLYPLMPHLIGATLWAPVLLGPSIYLYARAITSPLPLTLSLGEKRLFWAPGLIALLVALPLYLLDGATKLALIDGTLLTAPPSAALSMTVLNILFMIISVTYLGALLRLLMRNAQTVRTLFSNIEDKTLSWLRWVLFFLIAALVWSWVHSIWSQNSGAHSWNGALRALVEMAKAGVFLYFGIKQRPVFAVAEETPATASIPSKYARSALDDKRMSSIENKIRAVMLEDGLFRDPDLSLSMLATRTGVKANYISQTLNDRMGLNFFDFVNGYRINEAKTLLLSSSDTVLTIALNVGFNSRSTFNTAFSKHAGTTPSAFRASSS